MSQKKFPVSAHGKLDFLRQLVGAIMSMEVRSKEDSSLQRVCGNSNLKMTEKKPYFLSALMGRETSYGRL